MLRSQYSAVQYSAVQYSAVQYSAVQYSAVWAASLLHRASDGLVVLSHYLLWTILETGEHGLALPSHWLNFRQNAMVINAITLAELNVHT